MKKEMVSIIIPTYNSEKYIEKCLKSVIDQSYTNWEVIIVNEYDSNDKINNIIKKMRKKTTNKINLIQNTINLGRVKSRNKGIYEAKGEYIAFLDSDDQFLPEKLDIQLKFLKENLDYIGCGSQMEIYHGDKFMYHSKWHDLDEDILKVSLIFNAACWTSALVFRKLEYIKYDLFPNYNCCEDYEMIIKATINSKFKNVHGSLVKYFFHNNNSSQNKEVIDLEKKERVEITKLYLKHININIREIDIVNYILCNFDKYTPLKNKYKIYNCYLFFHKLHRQLSKSSFFKQENIDYIIQNKFKENYEYYITKNEDTSIKNEIVKQPNTTYIFKISLKNMLYILYLKFLS